MASSKTDERILALCARVTKKRARTVIDHIIEHGHITTEELQEQYGYDHPPRAARDVREEGIPLETFKIVSTRSGRKIAAYRFGDPSDIKNGRIGGRKAFSKAFKTALVEKYGERDSISGQYLDERYLQIDHRIPYEVAGDSSYDETNLDAYMLLDASSQRAKSWSCEHCENWKNILDTEICGGCYWAFPESYTHVSMKEYRRVDIRWDGDEVKQYDDLKNEAKKAGVSIEVMIKNKLRK